jgi:hypothetical protein
MAPHKKKDRRRTLRSLYVWHRWIGIICALLVLWLGATGILLNHGTRLGFDRAYVRSPWLLRAYGISPLAPQLGFPVSGHWIVQAGDQLFLDTRPVTELRGRLIGAAALPSVILAAARDSAVLMTPEGDLVESLGSESLPGPVLAVASSGRYLLIRTADGVYASDGQLLGFARHAGAWPGEAGEAQPLPPQIARGIVSAGAGIKLSRERVLTDLHSGRLLGRYGPWVMDLASVGFIFLALTGLWLWWRYRRTRQLRHRLRPD